MANLTSNPSHPNDNTRVSHARISSPMQYQRRKSGARTTTSHTKRYYHTLALLVVATCLMLLNSASAYSIGDVVDTDIRLVSETKDALRSQMPEFGVSTKVTLDLENQTTFSMSFEDALRGLPWVSINKYNGDVLRELKVTFVYTKSGGGMIHSVYSNAIYEAPPAGLQPSRFLVSYYWLEQAAVHWQTGQAVMFFMVLVASLFFLWHSCIGDAAAVMGASRQRNGGGGGGGGGSTSSSWSVAAASGSAVPKWD